MSIKRLIDESMPEDRPVPSHAIRFGNRSEERRPLPRLIESSGDEEDAEEVMVC